MGCCLYDGLYNGGFIFGVTVVEVVVFVGVAVTAVFIPAEDASLPASVFLGLVLLDISFVLWGIVK